MNDVAQSSAARRTTTRASTWRGSPAKGSPSGVRMSQNMRATALACGTPGQAPRTWKASGNASMSDSCAAGRSPRCSCRRSPCPPRRRLSSSPGTTANDFMLPKHVGEPEANEVHIPALNRFQDEVLLRIRNHIYSHRSRCVQLPSIIKPRPLPFAGIHRTAKKRPAAPECERALRSPNATTSYSAASTASVTSASVSSTPGASSAVPAAAASSMASTSA